MITKTFRIALTIVLASFALSSAAWATTCSNASLSGTYGWLHGGTASDGTPVTSVSQITFDPTTGTYTGEDIGSHDGVITTESVSATYAVYSNCTGTATVKVDGQLAGKIAFVVTSTGFLSLNVTPGGQRTLAGPGVQQGSPTCTNSGVTGALGFETTGVFVAGAPVIGPVAFIGELEFSVNRSGDGVISGHIAGSEDGTMFRFAEEPVTGSYTVGTDCWGTATITPKGMSALNFSFVVVNGGNELLAIETDTDTVVSGSLQR